VASLAAMLLGCGDNTLPVGVPLVHSRDLAIVAHSDDDLVYLQPDQLERARRGGATIVHVTDGGADADRRHAGLMLAYTAGTGFDGWQCGWIEVLGHAVEHCRLEDAHLSLVFLGYPEGDPAGDAPTSIARLWDGRLDIAISIGELTTAYRRDDVLDTLTALVAATQPRTVRTLDTAGIHGIDHADHAIVGAAALLAVAGIETPAGEPLPEVIAFRADGTGAEPATLIDPLFERSAGVLAYYDGCVERSAPCGEPAAVITEAHAAALRRRYAMSFRRGSGQLRLGIGATCMEPETTGLLDLVGCPSSVEWRLDGDGTLHAGDECIEVVETTGELIVVSSCAPQRNRRFFLDDEGHLWSGARPPIGPGGAMSCISVGTDPQATRCGSSSSALWELSPLPTQTARPASLPVGRATRLGDLGGDGHADLCAVIGGKLRCASGDGTGQFGALAEVAALSVEPESLTLGDVDGDGTLDACGRDVAGLVCLIAPQFTLQRWSPAFARSGPATATDRSLAAVDSDNNGTAEICGVGPAGVICASQDPVNLPEVRSAWPDAAAPAWPADLDGDRRADWCSRTPMGISCGIDLLSTLTTDGVPWTYSLSGIGDPFPADVVTGAMGDVDGDDRSDLCNIVVRDSGPQIACARSQGFGFGPLATLVTLPAGSYVGLYLGDLDGDGIDDACADDGTNLWCARSH
jgi:LmbE family N-acetylglucosaminyl deacetylase